MHGLAGLKQQRYGVFQIASAEAPAHNENYREIIIAQVQDLLASRTRVCRFLEDGVYGDSCRMYPLLWHTELRHVFGCRIVGDDVEIQVQRYPDGMRHVVCQHDGAEHPRVLPLVYPENPGAVEVRGYESLRAGARHQALQGPEPGRLHLLHERSPLARARRLIEPPVRRGPQLEGLQIRVPKQSLDARRDFVGEVHYLATLLGVEEINTTNHGRAGPHVAASYGARKDQDIRVVLIGSHGGIILVVDRQPRGDSQRRIEGGREHGPTDGRGHACSSSKGSARLQLDR